MQFLIPALIGVVSSVIAFFGVYNYVPQDVLSITSTPPRVGSTITTILGTDTLSASRSVINTNFSNLNTDKIEATVTTLNSLTTATALATIGTITTGVWNSSTPIGVLYGGTGTTSPTSNQVMIGNGSSGFKVIGFGTSGQFLTSGGDATAPSWTTSAIDQTGTYNWTGTHRFKTLIASSTVTFSNSGAGASYIFPITQGTVNTSLVNDGTGQLYWAGGGIVVASSTATVTQFSSTATTTLATFSVPANTLGTNGILNTTINTNSITTVPFTFTTGQTANVCVKYSTGVTCYLITGSGGGVSQSGTIQATLASTGTTNGQQLALIIRLGSTGFSATPAGVSVGVSKAIAIDSTSAQTFTVEIKFSNSSTDDGITTNGYNAIIYR